MQTYQIYKCTKMEMMNSIYARKVLRTSRSLETCKFYCNFSYPWVPRVLSNGSLCPKLWKKPISVHPTRHIMRRRKFSVILKCLHWSVNLPVDGQYYLFFPDGAAGEREEGIFPPALHNEYWMIYRGPGVLAGFPTPPSPSPVRKLDRSHTERETTCWRDRGKVGGKGAKA